MIFCVDDERKLTKKEKKELRKLEWQQKAKDEARDAKVKKISLWVGVIAVFLIVAFVLFQAVTSSGSSSTNQNIKIAAVSAKDMQTGNPKAKVVLVEYADFQCPGCAAIHPVVNQILNDYKSKILYVYRMFPLEDIHSNALVAAQAAYAAYKQNAFFSYDDMLFSHQAEWADLQDPTTAFVDYAKLLKLDPVKFKADINSQEAQSYVKNSENQALNEGVNQTPTFFLNGKMLNSPGTYDDFKTLIDAALSQS